MTESVLPESEDEIGRKNVRVYDLPEELFEEGSFLHDHFQDPMSYELSVPAWTWPVAKTLLDENNLMAVMPMEENGEMVFTVPRGQVKNAKRILREFMGKDVLQENILAPDFTGMTIRSPWGNVGPSNRPEPVGGACTCGAPLRSMSGAPGGREDYECTNGHRWYKDGERWYRNESKTDADHRLVLEGEDPDEVLFGPQRYWVTEFGPVRVTKFSFLEMTGDIANGGEIVLATNVTHSEQGRVKNFLATMGNRFGRMKKVSQALGSALGNQGWGFSLGEMFKGRYVDPEGSVFDEKSFSVKIAGVDSDLLPQIADALREEFRQQSVLVRDFNNNRTFFQFAGGTQPA